MRKVPARLVVTVICLVASALSLSAANLVTNGGFETNSGGACATTTFTDLTPGSTCLPGWAVDSGTVDYVNKSVWDAHSGNFSVDMDGINDGTISTTFATIAGATYNVQFWMASNFGSAPVVKTLQVSADGQSQTYTFNSTGKSATNMGWTLETFNFVANSGTAQLTFSSKDNPQTAAGAAIDDVSAVQAPEPGSTVFLLIGLAAVSAAYISQRKAISQPPSLP